MPPARTAVVVPSRTGLRQSLRRPSSRFGKVVHCPEAGKSRVWLMVLYRCGMKMALDPISGLPFFAIFECWPSKVFGKLKNILGISPHRKKMDHLLETRQPESPYIATSTVNVVYGNSFARHAQFHSRMPLLGRNLP